MKSYDPETVRAACYAAAEHIERDPRRYEFTNSWLPNSKINASHPTGCVIGWIAHFANFKGSPFAGDKACMALFGCPEDSFFKRLDALNGPLLAWRGSSKAAAQLMRAYADRYFPALHQQPYEWAALRAREAAAKRGIYERFRKTLNLTPLPEDDHACVSSRSDQNCPDRQARGASHDRHPGPALCVANEYGSRSPESG